MDRFYLYPLFLRTLTLSLLQIVFALGADDVFVVVDKWKSARAIMTRASTAEVAIISLPRLVQAATFGTLSLSRNSFNISFSLFV